MFEKEDKEFKKNTIKRTRTHDDGKAAGSMFTDMMNFFDSDTGEEDNKTVDNANYMDELFLSGKQRGQSKRKVSSARRSKTENDAQ